MRDNTWLQERLQNIQTAYFPDTHGKVIRIQFGKRAKARLGSIRPDKTTFSLKSILRGEEAPALILLTGHFKDEAIPSYVVDMTIAHELCHLVHGFLRIGHRLNNPHKHGKVSKELAGRGLESTLKLQRKWLKDNWRTYILETQAVRVTKRKSSFNIFRV